MEARALLEPELDVVGSVGDGRALVAMVEDLKPDVAVSDVPLPLLDAWTVKRGFKSGAASSGY